MKTLRYYWEGLLGAVLRVVISSFLFGLLLALLVSYAHWQLEKSVMPPKIKLSRKGWLILGLAISILVLNLYLARRDFEHHPERGKIRVCQSSKGVGSAKKNCR